MSRPNSSVPKRAPVLGGFSLLRKSWSFGSCGATTGAKRATTRSRAMTQSPATAALSCSRWRSASRQRLDWARVARPSASRSGGEGAPATGPCNSASMAMTALSEYGEYGQYGRYGGAARREGTSPGADRRVCPSDWQHRQHLETARQAAPVHPLAVLAVLVRHSESWDRGRHKADPRSG